MRLSAAKTVYTLVPAARRRVFEQVAEQVTTAHDKLATQWGVPQPAEWASVAQQHDVSTTFILASGSSINDYSEAMFERVRTGWSVAINCWCAHHTHVPNVLMVESLLQAEEVAHLEPSCRPSTLLVTRFPAHRRVTTKQLDSVPGGLPNIFRHYVALPMLGLTPSSYADYIVNLLDLRERLPHVLGPNRTSLERAVVIAALAGAREIVLCGVDLRGPHFWGSEPSDALKRHGTDHRKSFRRSVARRIPVLAAVLNSRLGTIVTLGMKRGPLAEVLPLHAWECAHRRQGETQ